MQPTAEIIKVSITGNFLC